MSNQKEIKEIIRSLKKKGWTHEGQNKHIKMRHPKGRSLTLPTSPSCHRALLNIKSEIRKIENAAKEAVEQIEKDKE